jgi:hypothetical protein
VKKREKGEFIAANKKAKGSQQSNIFIVATCLADKA